MPGHKFDPANHERLSDPGRAEFQPPEPALEALGITSGETLLDIGAGTGYFLIPAAKLVGRAIGLDVSREMLGKLMAAVAAECATNVDGMLITETSIPLTAGTAHAAICVNVLHEMDEPAKLLGEVRRVLKPDGRLLLVDWKKQETAKGPSLDHRVDIEAARRALEEAGFVGNRELPLYEQHYSILARSGDRGVEA